MLMTTVKLRCWCIFVFFFQAEDGIRDLTVTGVQTCALPISVVGVVGDVRSTTLTQESPALYYPMAIRVWPLMDIVVRDRKSTRLNSSHSQISYAVFCLKKKKNNISKYMYT